MTKKRTETRPCVVSCRITEEMEKELSSIVAELDRNFSLSDILRDCLKSFISDIKKAGRPPGSFKTTPP